MSSPTIDAPRTSTDELPADYAAILAELTAASTRETLAQAVDRLAAAAGTAAAAFKGRGVANSPTDPLAWHETAAMLLHLAAALRGYRLDVEEFSDRDYYSEDYWKDLMAAGSAAEFAAAFHALKAHFTKELDGDEEDDKRPSAEDTARRRFALDRMSEAGAAVVAGWAPARR
jgi:hypothetical protein